MIHRCTRMNWAVLALLAVEPLLTAQEPAAADAQRAGQMITIKGTVDTQLRHRVISVSQTAAREGVETLIYDLQVSGSDFAACYGLAKEIMELPVKRRIAYISRPLSGHAVLLALACDEIAMAEDVKIGNLSDDQRLADPTITEQTAYEEVARKNGYDKWLALAFLNRRLSLVEVETAAGGKRILPADRVEEFAKQARILKKAVIKEAGAPFILDAAAAKRLGIVRLLANSRREVALAYRLPESAAAADQLLDEAVRPVLLRIEGTIDGRTEGYVSRRLKQAEAQQYNLLFVAIDSTTGEASVARSIGQMFRAYPGRKVAWVPRQAQGPALFLVFGCDELVMSPKAMIGDYRTESAGPEELKALAKSAEDLASAGKFPMALVRRFLDKNLVVYQVVNTANRNLRALKTAEELEDPLVKKQWDQQRLVKDRGPMLKLDGTEAQTLDLAQGLANNEDELRSLYPFKGSLPVLQPSWVDALVDGLTSVGGTVFLLVVGMICLYIEFQIPGFGIAGMISAVCFVLFFWAQYLSGTANSLEIVLFLLGLTCLAIELFVLPGFGFAGLLGVVLILSSLVLASQSFVIPQSGAQAAEMLKHVLTVAASLLVFLVGAFTIARYFPQMPLFSRMMLAPPGEPVEEEALFAPEEPPEISPYAELVGKKGVAASPLRPAGRMQFGDRLFDVVAQGEFIEPGTPIEVLEVYQNRIVVRETSDV